MIKDSGYGSFNYDEDSSKMVALEESVEDEQKAKRRKLSCSRKSKGKGEEEGWRDLANDRRSLENTKDLDEDKEDNFVKDFLPEAEPLTASRLSVDLDSSRSCSSLAPSSVRNRSPSMDRNSQTTRNSDMNDEEDENIARRRISPFFVCGTPRSFVESSSNSENEEETLIVNQVATSLSPRERTTNKIHNL